VIYIIIFNFI